jgi:hypothetical protein
VADRYDGDAVIDGSAWAIVQRYPSGSSRE